MHFWIDKRQPCNGRTFGPCIGRNGFGFTQHRRFRNKAVVTNFQCSTDPRPQVFRQAQAQQSSAQTAATQSSAQQQQQSNHHQHHHHKSHNHHHHHHHHRSTSAAPFDATAAQQVQSLPSNPDQPFYHQSSSSLQISPQYHSTSSSPVATGGSQSQQDSGSYFNLSVPLNQNYRAGHTNIDLIDDYDTSSASPPPTTIQQQQRIHDNQSPSIGGLSATNSNNHATLVSQSSTIVSNENVRSGVGNGMVSHDPQLLPAHLKCGMWASLALASVLVAGAKFYFDHQGTGLEVLIFCAFSATFFIFACTVSLCRRTKDTQTHHIQQNVSIDTDIEGSFYINQNNNNTISLQIRQPAQVNSNIGPPPPYHIAILLPEIAVKQASNLSIDETPPPSYDKIII